MPQYDKHYITIFLVADWVSGEPVNKEPHKCEGWEWLSLEELLELKQKLADWIPLKQILECKEHIAVSK